MAEREPVGRPADPRAEALQRAGWTKPADREPAMPLVLALVLVGLLLGYLLAVFPCPLKLRTALGCLVSLSAALALPASLTP